MARYVPCCEQDTPPRVLPYGAMTCDDGLAQVCLWEVPTVDVPDASSVAGVWSAAFSLVLVCYVVGKGVGVLLDMIKEG